MGDPIERLSGNERVTVPSHLLDRRGGDHYVLRVVGDSMADEHVLDGDYAVIRRGDDWLPGEAHIVIVGDEATIKRVYFASDPGKLRLEPLSGAADQGKIYPASIVKVQGLAVGIMRKF